MEKVQSPAEMTSQEVWITHVFNADPQTVFRAWTDPNQLAQWYAPDGCTITFKKADIRKGGHYHSCIHHPVHGDCWCKGTYLEMEAPRKLVFTAEVTDAQGNDIDPVTAGMPADWPAKTTVTLEFKPLGTQTEMILHQTVAASLAKATGAFPSWIEMFNRLNQQL
ncbi:SRPBCC domain-containing protein [Niabella sp. CC-SYL272]|uniref:SRPBCC family protein n=1 Tax=Niabella agricola TaxID=2891571 RepID=UPI001F33AFE4|nr:SRPBCC domain-containing protein [Niabella agricola]MCF3108160.1 SRPBCC domain-containing protein [Niabella agricola]